MNIDKIEIAELIATTAHTATGQKRKYTNQPYIVHPAEVVILLKKFGITDENILSAAWLHDVVEDTELTLEFIRWNICNSVAEIVEMVTDISQPEDGNRATRKMLDREHYETADARGKIVKLADCLSNGYDIQKHDKNFAVVYFKEIKLLLPYLKGGNKKLYNAVYKMIKDYELDVENERLQTALNKI